MEPDRRGRRLIQASWAGTIVFTVTAVVAAIALGPARYAAIAVALALFAAGIVAFLWAYAIAVQRSRDVEIGIGGLYFLAGETAPKQVRRLLNGSLAVQVVVGLATASARPFTTLAFGALVPMFGLGCNGLWGARYGHFGPRIIVGGPAGDDSVAAKAGKTAAKAEKLSGGADKMSGGAAPIDQNEDHG